MSLDGPEALEQKSVRWEKMIHSGNLEDIIRQEIKWKRNGKEIGIEFKGKSRSKKKILVNKIVIPSPWNSAHAIVFCFINCILLIDSVYEVCIFECHFREASHCSTGLVNWTSWTGWSFWYSMVPMWMPGMRYYEIVSILNHKKFSLNFVTTLKMDVTSLSVSLISILTTKFLQKHIFFSKLRTAHAIQPSLTWNIHSKTPHV